jgi:hypothetical protein
VRYGLFVGTKRSALVAGTVTTTEATSTGYVRSPRLMVEGLICETEASAAGLAFGNIAAVAACNLDLGNLKYGGAWRGYADQ